MTKATTLDTTTTLDILEETILPLGVIRTDGGTQPRAGLIEEEVEEYAYHLRNEVVFPPVEVVYDGTDYYLTDGFHRLEAHKRADKTEIAARVSQGTREDAVWTSYRANITNGIRRNTADRQRAIVGALTHPHGAELTDRAIADHCGADPSTIAKWRKKLIAQGELPDPHQTQEEEPATPSPDQTRTLPASALSAPASASDPAPDDDEDAAALDAPTDPREASTDNDDQAQALTAQEAAGAVADDPAPVDIPALPEDLEAWGWTLEARDTGWQGVNGMRFIQTDVYPTPDAAIAAMWEMERAIGNVEAAEEQPADEPEEEDDPDAADLEPATDLAPAAEAPPLAERMEVALTVNLLGLMYQIASERWEAVAPGTDAWTAVPCDVDILETVGERLMAGPVREALGSVQA